jgi:hypothetical protein
MSTVAHSMFVSLANSVFVCFIFTFVVAGPRRFGVIREGWIGTTDKTCRVARNNA